MTERVRYRVLEVRYEMRRRPGDDEAAWLVYLCPVSGPPTERYLLRLAVPVIGAPPYAAGKEVILDSRWLTLVEAPGA